MNSIKRDDTTGINSENEKKSEKVSYDSFLRIFLCYMIPVILFAAYYFYTKSGS